MELLLRPRMAKTGRPRKDEGDAGTTQIRVFDEMAEMVSDLLLVLPLSTAQIMQRVALTDLKELHETHKPRVEKVKAARRAAETVMMKAREEAELMDRQAVPKPSTPRKPRGES